MCQDIIFGVIKIQNHNNGTNFYASIRQIANFNICDTDQSHLSLDDTNSEYRCRYHHLQYLSSRIENVYIHRISSPIIALNRQSTETMSENWYLLYPQFIQNNHAISIAIYIEDIWMLHRSSPISVEYRQIMTKFRSKCHCIKLNPRAMRIVAITEGTIQTFNKMGSMCSFAEPVYNASDVIKYLYYLHLQDHEEKIQYLIQLYPSTNEHNLSIGIHSPIFVENGKDKIQLDAYFTHINYHINLGVSAYFMYDMYGDLYYNFHDEWIFRNNSQHLNILQRIDIFVYHLSHMRDREEMARNKYYIVNKSLPFSSPYIHQGIVIGLIYFQSLSMQIEHTLFVDLDEFISLLKYDDIPEFIDKELKYDMVHVGIQRKRYNRSYCYYNNLMNANTNNLEAMIFQQLHYNVFYKSLVQCDKIEWIGVHPSKTRVPLISSNIISIRHYRAFWSEDACKYILTNKQL